MGHQQAGEKERGRNGMCRTAHLPTSIRIQAAGWRPLDSLMVNGHKAPTPRTLNDKIVPLPSGDELAAATPDIRSRDRRNTFLHLTIPVSFFAVP